jgi:hypothetical protein
MMFPRWLLFLVATWVIAFGVYRIVIATRGRPADDDRPNFRQKGLYARSPRSHALLGALYVVLGVILVAMGFGWVPPVAGADGCLGGDPEGRSVGPDSPGDTAPR